MNRPNDPEHPAPGRLLAGEDRGVQLDHSTSGIVVTGDGAIINATIQYGTTAAPESSAGGGKPGAADSPGYTDPVDPASLEIPPEYLSWLARSCEWMAIDNLRDANPEINVSLPNVFIPLHARPPRREKAVKRRRGPEDMEPGDMEKEAPRDIEELILEEPFLVVEGQAGSGKTTVLRHFCHAVSQGTLAGDRQLLPILIFCKDIEAPREKTRPGARVFEGLLERHLSDIGCGLDAGAVKAFCQVGRAVILVDGLDEIPADLRDWVVESLHDFRERHGRPKTVLAGRPHGLNGAVTTRFLDGKVMVETLVEAQVEDFVRKWFCHVPDPKAVACRSSAEELLAAMRAHEHLDEMKDTPLMLTSVCMLWYDGKTLPDQRMDLYDKFVSYLLKKRFGNSEREKRFLMALAYRLHLELKRRDIDANPAVEILKTVYPRERRETEADHDARVRREFERIEAGCGLIRVENGRYVFWHLSFQAFLAALHCVNGFRERERAAMLENRWEDDWFKEFIPIYIGSLCLTRNTLEAHDVVREQLEREDAAPFTRWRLAAAGMESIHKDYRQEDVLDLARDRMLEIMASEAEAAFRANAGRILGRLGDPRDLNIGIRIPAGVYRLANGKVKIEKDFEIGKYPVTNGWFREFIEDGGYGEPRFWTPNGRKWLAHTGAKMPKFWHDRQWNNPSAPVVGVCWWEAVAFLNWLTETRADGGKYGLPTEVQWEAAAAGREGKGEYPWRGGWKEDHCNSRKARLERTSVVGVFPKGDTPEGVVDMAGNVWEWTAPPVQSSKEVGEAMLDLPFDEEVQSLYESGQYFDAMELYDKKYKNNPVLRGGSWDLDSDLVARAYRYGDHPIARFNLVGLRWARTF